MYEPNADLLYATLDHVIAVEPLGLWDQNRWWGYAGTTDGCGCAVNDLDEPCVHQQRVATWREARQEDPNICGTAGCFAGWALVLAHEGVAMKEHGAHVDVVMADKSTVCVATNDSVSDLARKALGLDHVQGSRLFNGSNTLADLKAYVDEYAGGRDA